VLPGGLPPPPPCRLSPDLAAAILRLRTTSGRSSNLAIVGSEGLGRALGYPRPRPWHETKTALHVGGCMSPLHLLMA
jgi:hypothetical protein